MALEAFEVISMTRRVCDHMEAVERGATRREKARILAAGIVSAPALLAVNVLLPSVYHDAMDDLMLAHRDEVDPKRPEYRVYSDD